MRLIFGDRATVAWEGQRIPLTEIVEVAAKRWFSQNLRFVDPERHLVYQNEIRPGSLELTDLFARQQVTANDTSAAVGYAPLSETEQIVLAAERHLNSPDFKQGFPEVGEDVKVMAVRRGRSLSLTIAAAFVDRFIPNASAYFERKGAVRAELTGFLKGSLRDLDNVEVQINALDDPARGASGMYLTVLGTSAEGADSGQVGRGNRVNGVISLNRPMSLEAAAGKNPVSHVGKIYNLLSHRIAQQLYESLPPVEQATVWLCSRIGSPLDEPWSVDIRLVLAGGDVLDKQFSESARGIVLGELARIPAFVLEITRGAFPVC